MTTCGYGTGTVWDSTRANWHNDGPRPIAWSAWHPTSQQLATPHIPGGFFNFGKIAPGAALAPGHRTFAVVLLSHGTGGTAESLGWLARALAGAGHVVIGANHHGNSGVEPDIAKGFLCWWERAADLSLPLTSLNTEGDFACRLNMGRVTVVGFSLGGHTALTLAGARTCPDTFDAWATANGVQSKGPAEVPNAADHIPRLQATSKAFCAAWHRQRDDFRDTRIEHAVLIAPAPPVRAFPDATIAALTQPVTILSGGADTEAPPPHCADWLARLNHRFVQHLLGAHVGHYTFLDLPSDPSLIGRTDLFTDHPQVERSTVHAPAARVMCQALA